MDHDTFDRLTRLLGTPGSRRAALGALLGSSVLGAAESAFARKNGKGKGKSKSTQRVSSRKQRNQRRDKNRGVNASGQDAQEVDDVVAIEATCGSPGPSSNLSGCNFNNDILDGYDLSGSNMKNTKFNGASLCGAKLHSSTLTNADFRSANLTKADLHSSGCNGIKTNAGTTFCQTTVCNGNINNSDCPSGTDVCCDADDCGQRECRTASCDGNGCEYAEQPGGQLGTLCPRECCGGACCPAGQKCCDGSCIPNASCCEADCAANEKCCGDECIADTICCTDGDPGVCPPNQQCCPGFDAIDPNDNDAGVCKNLTGGTCRDHFQPELDCCGPSYCCDDGDGLQCKQGGGEACIGNDDCCQEFGFGCGRVNDDLAICCKSSEEDSCNTTGNGAFTPCCPPLFCNDDFECEAP